MFGDRERERERELGGLEGRKKKQLARVTSVCQVQAGSRHVKYSDKAGHIACAYA
jgi:hypothetical protein